MSTKEFSYRKFYNWLEKASSWQAIDLWKPDGVVFSGKWVIDATKLPKSLKDPLRGHILAIWKQCAEKTDTQAKIIRLTLMELENANHVVYSPATRAYIQLTFYHPKA